jgi:Uma2 family endonuclease
VTVLPIDFVPPGDGWTTDDLDEFPADGRRRELIDGVLIVSPVPTSIHQIIAMRVGGALEESCPTEYEATLGIEIRISRRRAFVPDIMVVTTEAAARGKHHVTPEDVLLAVEVVSPNSHAMDRVTKPALYAEAGIPFYWRVETDGGIVVHTHRIDPAAEIYRPTGQHSELIETSEPWEISIPIARITPRFLSR